MLNNISYVNRTKQALCAEHIMATEYRLHLQKTKLDELTEQLTERRRVDAIPPNRHTNEKRAWIRANPHTADQLEALQLALSTKPLKLLKLLLPILCDKTYCFLSVHSNKIKIFLNFTPNFEFEIPQNQLK